MRHQIDDITEALCKQLSRLAGIGKIDDADLPDAAKRTNRKYGVVVWYNKADLAKLKVEFVTHDDIHIETVIDLHDASRGYFERMAHEIMKSIDEHRKKRQVTPIFDMSPLAVALRS